MASISVSFSDSTYSVSLFLSTARIWWHTATACFPKKVTDTVMGGMPASDADDKGTATIYKKTNREKLQ
jgi:hypothetical protein